MNIFGGIRFCGNFYAYYGLFLRSRYRMGYFGGGGGAKISNIFLECLIFLIFTRGEWWMLGPSFRMKK